MVECSDDCSSVYDTYKLREVYSCAVTDGVWIFYDLPNYSGRQYLLERGEYRQHADWGASSPGVGSFRRITEFWLSSSFKQNGFWYLHLKNTNKA